MYTLFSWDMKSQRQCSDHFLEEQHPRSHRGSFWPCVSDNNRINHSYRAERAAAEVGKPKVSDFGCIRAFDISQEHWLPEDGKIC